MDVASAGVVVVTACCVVPLGVCLPVVCRAWVLSVGVLGA